MESRPDRIDRLLTLWLDLQRAMARNGRRRIFPWTCTDEEVTRLWKRITDPENLRGLEEWLFHIGPGELEFWAQRALLECRRRAEEDQEPRAK